MYGIAATFAYAGARVRVALESLSGGRATGRPRAAPTAPAPGSPWTAAPASATAEGCPTSLTRSWGSGASVSLGGSASGSGSRALYHKPEVLVMDEATSAHDNQTERHIVEALEQLQGQHTMIVIVHRLSTVRNCDTLFMLDERRLVAEGSHDELMTQSEEFRRMAGEPATPELAVTSSLD